MIMCYDPTRTVVRHADMPMPPLTKIIDIYERMASIITPSRVIAVALNTYAQSEAEARVETERMRAETGLPAADVIRDGPDEIAEAVLSAEREFRPLSAQERSP